MKKTFLNILKFLGAAVLILLLSLQCSFSFCKMNGSNYGEFFFEECNIADNTKITDIAMLGAHDAFTSELSRKNGGNIYEGGLANNTLVAALGGGFVTRLTKAQWADAYQMLLAGVRYFDVRITRIDGKYYAFHGYLAGEISSYVRDIADFLENHPNEFIIFDIQHFYTENGENFDLPDSDYAELLNYLGTIKNGSGKSITDYVFYNANEDALSELTYGDIKGGVLMLGKIKGSDILYERDGDGSYDNSREYTSIYSYWINHNNTDVMLQRMQETMDYVSARSDLDNVLRVNQAQKTGFFTDGRLVSSVFQWSLLDMAADFNKKLVSDEERLINFLEACPILMVDNAASTDGDFNIRVIDIMREYNQKTGE